MELHTSDVQWRSNSSHKMGVLIDRVSQSSVMKDTNAQNRSNLLGPRVRISRKQTINEGTKLKHLSATFQFTSRGPEVKHSSLQDSSSFKWLVHSFKIITLSLHIKLLEKLAQQLL